MSVQSVSREDGPARGTTGKILPRMQVCLLGLGALAACSTTPSEPDVCFPVPEGTAVRVAWPGMEAQGTHLQGERAGMPDQGTTLQGNPPEFMQNQGTQLQGRAPREMSQQGTSLQGTARKDR